jgi:hypothetical protein
MGMDTMATEIKTGKFLEREEATKKRMMEIADLLLQKSLELGTTSEGFWIARDLARYLSWTLEKDGVTLERTLEVMEDLLIEANAKTT